MATPEALELARPQALRSSHDPSHATRTLFARAHALDTSGRNKDAKEAYLDVLHLDPTHFDALMGLASLLVKTGYRTAARTALLQAAQVRPESASAHTALAILLADDGEASAAREHYERALRLNPNDDNAHKGLAVLLLRLGETEAARRHGRLGFHGRADAWDYRGMDRPLSLLLVLSAHGGNVPIDQFIDDRVFRKWTLVPEFMDPSAELPPHDLVLNGVGDADRCAAALETAMVALARTHAPILNAPARVRETGRAANAERLGRIPGVVTARTVELPRECLAAPDAARVLAARGFGWPLAAALAGVSHWRVFR